MPVVWEYPPSPPPQPLSPFSNLPTHTPSVSVIEMSSHQAESSRHGKTQSSRSSSTGSEPATISCLYNGRVNNRSINHVMGDFPFRCDSSLRKYFCFKLSKTQMSLLYKQLALNNEPKTFFNNIAKKKKKKKERKKKQQQISKTKQKD